MNNLNGLHVLFTYYLDSTIFSREPRMELLPETSDDETSVAGVAFVLASMSLFSFSYCAAAANIYSGVTIGI